MSGLALFAKITGKLVLTGLGFIALGAAVVVLAAILAPLS